MIWKWVSICLNSDRIAKPFTNSLKVSTKHFAGPATIICDWQVTWIGFIPAWMGKDSLKITKKKQRNNKEITKKIKKSVQELNPTITNTSQQLYGDLWDKFELDQSNRTFYSNANTKIANDQGAFIKFLYGDLPSGKDGSKSELLANSGRYLLLG